MLENIKIKETKYKNKNAINRNKQSKANNNKVNIYINIYKHTTKQIK